jgi:hypothetical protein
VNDIEHPRELLVGDDEREHVAGLLEKAVSRGLLDIDEFTARSDAALAATTRADLNAVLVDLPGAEATPDRLELVGSWSRAITRRGRWAVPGLIVVRNRWRPAELDFTFARFLTDEVRVHMDSTGAPVTLRLPVGAGAVVADLGTVWGATVQDTRPAPLTDGSPRFVISGTLRLAPLVLTGPPPD